MCINRVIIRNITVLFIFNFSILLAACGGGGGGGGDGDGGGNSTAGLTLEASAVEGICPLEVKFDVDSDSEITNASWDFGDGDTEKQYNATNSVSHTYTTPGVYTVSVNVDSSATARDEKLTGTIQITIIPDVNLVVSSFAIDTEIDVVDPSNLETVSAIIQNIGTDELSGSGFINVGYYLSTDDNITVDDIYIGDTSIHIGDSFTPGQVPFGFEKLSPGENYQYNHQLAVKRNIPSGTYFAGAIVDYIDYYNWYTFPRATDTLEYVLAEDDADVFTDACDACLEPVHVVVTETNENDNARLLSAHQVTVPNAPCIEDSYEEDDDSANASPISVGDSQVHNFCFDNSDWLRFDAVEGSVYKISTSSLEIEADTQLSLYDRDGASILLFADNLGNTAGEKKTVDLLSGFPVRPESEIVWEAEFTGTYFIKVRTTACDEDIDDYCLGSPDGVGLDTGYTITIQ